jgi:transcriptional regulator with XRE-family HTH domain
MMKEEFAERIGISQNYLSTMERGKVEIGAEILLRISREFVKSVEWLLTGEARQAEHFCWRRTPHPTSQGRHISDLCARHFGIIRAL